MSTLLSLIPTIFGKLLDWLPSIAAYFTGRAAGKAAVVREAQAEVARVQAAEARAAAEAPRTVDGVADSLRKGAF